MGYDPLKKAEYANYEKTIQAYIQHGAQTGTPQYPKLVSEQSTSGSVPASAQPAFKTQNYLLPAPLDKGISPLETSEWVDKFDYWFSMAYCGAEDAGIKAKELKNKLDVDWVNHLKGVLDWPAADYEDIIEAI